ncbi:hypothetical protein OROHE_019290 [Orobanche hederae]
MCSTRSEENQHIFSRAPFTDLCSTRSLFFFSVVDEVRREPTYIFPSAIYISVFDEVRRESSYIFFDAINKSMFDEVRREPAYIFSGAIYRYVFGEVSLLLLLWHRRGPKIWCDLVTPFTNLVTRGSISRCFLVCWRRNIDLVVSSPDKLKEDAGSGRCIGERG